MSGRKAALECTTLLCSVGVTCLLVAIILRVPVMRTQLEPPLNVVPMTVRASGLGEAACASLRNCQCTNVASGSPACGSKHTAGTCGNGYHCCETVCDTCYDSTGAASQCSCTCVTSVANQQCDNVVTTCYTPWALVRYAPASPVKSMTTAYNDCVAAGGTASACAPRLQYYDANLTRACGEVDDGGSACAQAFVAAFHVGRVFEGTYRTTDYSVVSSDVAERTASTLLWVAFWVAAALGALCCLAGMCTLRRYAMMVLGDRRKREARTEAQMVALGTMSPTSSSGSGAPFPVSPNSLDDRGVAAAVSLDVTSPSVKLEQRRQPRVPVRGPTASAYSVDAGASISTIVTGDE